MKLNYINIEPELIKVSGSKLDIFLSPLTSHGI